MKTLANLLKEFDGRHLTESQLTEQFEMIAKAAIYGGHFRVNDEDDTVSSVHDFAMYHRGAVDWFPVGSLHPHRSGIDVTFEREGAYRASFLIRKYAIENEIINTPSYLPEDLIGYTGCILGDGPKIEWVDTNYDDKPLKRNPRIKVRAYDEQGIPLNDDKGNKQYDNRPWRFTKA